MPVSLNTQESTDPIVRLEADLLRFCPSRGWEVQLVTFPDTPDSDVTIAHSLTVDTPESINYTVLQTNCPMMVYHEPTSTWTHSTIRVRSTAGGGQAIILLTTSKDTNPLLEQYNGTTAFQIDNGKIANFTFTTSNVTTRVNQAVSWSQAYSISSLIFSGARGGAGAGTFSLTFSLGQTPTVSPAITSSDTTMNLEVGRVKAGVMACGTAVSTSITADQNNYNPTGWPVASILLIEPSGANRSLTGLQSTPTYTNWLRAGRMVYVQNNGSTYTLTLVHASASSDSDNRFNLPFGENVVLGPGEAIMLVWNGTNWSMIGRNRIFTNGSVYLGNNTATSLASAVRFRTGSAQYNWQAGAQINFSDVFEITPSTAVGGSTFSTPALTLTRVGNLEIPGLFTTTGFGTHSFNASGTGANKISIRNSAVGTGNESNLVMGNDASVDFVQFRAFSSTYTTSQFRIANSLAILSEGAGGMTLVTSDASGPIRFFSGGTSEVGRFHSNTFFGIGTTPTFPFHLAKSNNGAAVGVFQNTHASAPFGLVIDYPNASPNGTSNEFLVCTDSGGTRAAIDSNGGLVNYQANDIDLSDANMKDISNTPIGSMREKFRKLTVRKGKYKGTKRTHLMMVAQEVEAIDPEWTGLWKGGLLGIRTQAIQLAAYQVIQELDAEVTKLKERIEKLEK